MNNNKQPKQGNFVKNILMWVILAIVVVVGFNFFFSSNQSSVDKISYSQLMTKLDGNKIENVTMQPSDSLITVTGEYKEPVKVKGTNNFPLLGNSSSEVKNFQ
ncbi:MAG TPA: cell division protein FtsH, partial [Lactococcus lactis]|nr:cell division protein FtsH [Lactococcus lactis]